jgi:hypothetical protein
MGPQNNNFMSSKRKPNPGKTIRFDLNLGKVSRQHVILEEEKK